MTDQEYSSAEAYIADCDNEIAALQQTERQCTEQVRKFADGRRTAASQRMAIELATKPIREALAEHVRELRRQAAEKAKADAAAKAAEPAKPTAIEVLMKEVAELKEMLKAKE